MTELEQENDWGGAGTETPHRDSVGSQGDSERSPGPPNMVQLSQANMDHSHSRYLQTIPTLATLSPWSHLTLRFPDIEGGMWLT